MKQKQLVKMLLLAACLLFAAERGLQAQPYGTKEIKNIVYKSADGVDLALNLFLPVQNGKTLEKAPTLIYLDSGCWYSKGPGNGGIWRMMKMVEQGYAVVSVGHRSLEHFIFPCQIEDVRAAVRFLRAHAEEYGLDPNRFASMGCSSGGHLSMCLGIPDGSPFDVGDNLDQSSQVQVVIDFFGPSDFVTLIHRLPKTTPPCGRQVLGYDENRSEEEQMPEMEEKGRLYSPITYVNEKYAPTLILHGAVDPTVPMSQSALMYEALVKADVKTKIHIEDRGVHDPKTLGKPQEIMKLIVDFLHDCGM